MLTQACRSRLDLKSVLLDIFAAEGTVTVTGLWNHTGWTVRIECGSEATGAQRTFNNAALDCDVLADWLARTFADLHPKTDFARKYAWLASPARDNASSLPVQH